MNPALLVGTGAPDDGRRSFAPGDALYDPALRAVKEQDNWSDDYHRGFWQALLPLWAHRPGTVPIRQRLDALGGYLFTVAPVANWSRADIARLLGVAVDSLRRQRYGLESRSTRWWPGQGDRRHRLPRVYREGDPEPDGHPAIAVTPPYAPALEQIEDAVRSAFYNATADGPTPRLLAVFALYDGSTSALLRGLPDGADKILAVTETQDGPIAYDPIRVALGLEWLDAPSPAPSEWEEVDSAPERPCAAASLGAPSCVKA